MLSRSITAQNGFQSFVKTETLDWEHFNEIFMDCLELMDTLSSSVQSMIIMDSPSKWSSHQ